MAKRQAPATPQPKRFTVPEIDAGIRKLRRRLEQVRALDATTMRHDDPRVEAAESAIRETILDVFGPQSPEYDEHSYHEVWKGSHVLGPDREAQAKFADGIQQSVVVLEGLVARLEEKREDLSVGVVGQGHPSLIGIGLRPSHRVFIVHGHDLGARDAVARFVEQLSLDAVILSEQVNQGRTIIENFEHHADVSFAIVVLTPDDIGSTAAEPDVKQPRARQNVVLELGYFIGRLTRRGVCALHKGVVELPSDLHAVMYLQMDDAGGWKLKLAAEMKAAGLDVDTGRLLHPS